MAVTEKTLATKPSLLSGEALQALTASLQGLRFGSIEIVVHDGQIVQIDRLEKFRLDKGYRKTDGR